MSFWRNSMVKSTRKEHQCEFCNGFIPIGSTVDYCCGMWEGEFQSYYLCTRCATYIERNHIDLSEGFNPGDFTEHVLSSLPNCPNCGKYNQLREYDWDNSMMLLSLECDNCDHKWVEDYSMTKEGER